MTPDFDIDASRATEPFFYRAPHPDKKHTTPRLYQHAGVEYALARDHCLIGDAPGLGKTWQAVLLSNAIEAKRTLVVCPASLRLNWEREIWKLSTIENVSTYPILKSRDGVALDRHYVIVSYALLANNAVLNALLDQRWDHLVLDEAQAMKDPKGNTRTRAICGYHEGATDYMGLVDVADRITALTGSPMPNQPIEAYNMIRLLNWDTIDKGSLEDFRNAYYTYGSGMIRGPVQKKRADGTVYTVSELHWSNRVQNVPTNLADLQRRMRKHVMVRRLKTQVLKELPPVQWHPFPVHVNGALKEVLRHPGWQQAERLYEMDPSGFARSLPVDGAIATARRLLGEAKVEAVCDYVEDLLAEDDEKKVVVAAYNLSVLDAINARLKKYGLVTMRGGTSPTAKQRAVDEFQTDPKVRIISGQSLVLGIGWTLTAAQDVVFGEFDWVPENNAQLLDRISRIGQMGSYTIGHVPLVPGTLDERIVGNAVEKAVHIHDALDREHQP